MRGIVCWRRRRVIALGASFLLLCVSGVAHGGDEPAVDFSLMDAVGGRPCQKVADVPEGTFIEFLLVKPDLFVPGKAGQKLYLFSFGKGWFQIREDIPEIDLVAGGGLRHFHLADVLPRDRVFARLGLRDVRLYRKRIYFAKIEDPKPLRKLGVLEAKPGDLVTAHHYRGWVWRIRVAMKGRVVNIEVDAEAWYRPRADLGAALAAAGIAVRPGDVRTSPGVRFLAKVRNPKPLARRGLTGIEAGAEVILETAAEAQWRVNCASIGFPLSVLVEVDQLEGVGVEDARLLRIPEDVEVEGRVVSPKLARKAGLPETGRDQRVSIGFQRSTKKVVIRAGEKRLVRGLEELLTMGGE